MKHYAISDGHANDSPKSAVDRLVEFINCRGLVHGESLMLLGDMFPFALEATLDEMMASDGCRRVRDALVAAFMRGLPIRLLDGNHDPYTKLSAADRRRFLDWLGFEPLGFPGKAVLVTAGVDKVQFSHGDQYDITSKIWPVVVDILIAGLGVKRGMSFIRWVLGMWARRQVVTPMAMLERDPDAYRLMVPVIHDAAWRALLENTQGVNKSVFGHSHFDEVRTKPMSGMVLCNVGAWDGGGSSYGLYDDATRELSVERW